jgi:hypothetical protein
VSRILYYPSLPAPPADGSQQELSCGEHTGAQSCCFSWLPAWPSAARPPSRHPSLSCDAGPALPALQLCTLCSQSLNLGGLCGFAPAADYGLLTLVFQEAGVTALQVQNAAGRWVDAPPLPGTCVVNIGDMFRVLTNGMYTPTVHRSGVGSAARRVAASALTATAGESSALGLLGQLRERAMHAFCWAVLYADLCRSAVVVHCRVVNASGRDRVSVPFFYETNFEAVVSPHPQFCKDRCVRWAGRGERGHGRRW